MSHTLLYVELREDEICLQMKDDLEGLAKKLEITPEKGFDEIERKL